MPPDSYLWFTFVKKNWSGFVLPKLRFPSVPIYYIRWKAESASCTTTSLLYCNLFKELCFVCSAELCNRFVTAFVLKSGCKGKGIYGYCQTFSKKNVGKYQSFRLFDKIQGWGAVLHLIKIYEGVENYMGLVDKNCLWTWRILFLELIKSALKFTEFSLKGRKMFLSEKFPLIRSWSKGRFTTTLPSTTQS